MKICPAGAELFHEERQTDMMVIDAIRNFANAPKKDIIRV
jgi:hypothetical protein